MLRNMNIQIATITNTITRLFSGLQERFRLVWFYPTVRNRIVKRAGIYVISGYLLAHGFIVVGLLLIMIGLIADEV